MTRSAASTVTSGIATSITATAVDQFGNRAAGYLGTVHFAKTDTATGSAVPSDYTFTAGDSGQHVFSGVVLVTAGSQTITATDMLTASIMGNAAVTVNVAGVGTLRPSQLRLQP